MECSLLLVVYLFLFYFQKMYVIMDHSWMKDNRLNKEYENEVIQFLEFAEKTFLTFLIEVKSPSSQRLNVFFVK